MRGFVCLSRDELDLALNSKGRLLLPVDGIKRDPERENCAVLTISAQMANSIHIRVTLNAVTRYHAELCCTTHSWTRYFA